MNFLSFQDLSNGLNLASIEFHNLLAIKSKTAILKKFYLENYGQQPNKDIDIQDAIKKARKEFEIMLRISDIYTTGLSGYENSVVINNEKCPIPGLTYNFQTSNFLDPKTYDLLFRLTWEHNTTCILAENHTDYKWNEINEIKNTWEEKALILLTKSGESSIPLDQTQGVLIRKI